MPSSSPKRRSVLPDAFSSEGVGSAKVVKSFTSLAKSSLKEVKVVTSSQLIVSPASPETHGETIMKASRYLFTELAGRALRLMEHGVRIHLKVEDLVKSVENFAVDVKRYYCGVPYFHPDEFPAYESDEEWNEDSKEIAEDEETEGMDEDEESEGAEEDEDSDESDEDDTQGCDAGMSTPLFDKLFPFQSSTKIVNMTLLEKMWTQSLQELKCDVRVYGQKAFFAILQRVLNAYVTSVLLEPRDLATDAPNTK